MSLSPHYTALSDLDKQTKHMCLRLVCSALEPDDRIMLAEAIVMLQQDRKAMVQEIMR